jgi:hypothetical protein
LSKWPKLARKEILKPLVTCSSGCTFLSGSYVAKKWSR